MPPAESKHTRGAAFLAYQKNKLHAAAAVIGAAEAAASACIRTDLQKLVPTLKFFQGFSEATLSATVDVLTAEVMPDGGIVMAQGEHGDRFYILLTGDVEVDIDGHVVATLHAGSAFGELALMQEGEFAVRAATIRCVGECHLAWLGRHSYQRLIRRETELKFLPLVEFFRANQLFRDAKV